MYQHYNHCYYGWFRLSCIHLSMPFMGYAINLALADCKRKDQSAARIILTFPLRVIILPWVILKDIWQGKLKQFKIYEAFFEAFPQVLFLTIESSLCILVCILIKKDYKEVLSFFYIFSANILPHCVMDKKIAVMMILKSVYNLLFISILFISILIILHLW